MSNNPNIVAISIKIQLNVSCKTKQTFIKLSHKTPIQKHIIMHLKT